MIPVSYTHLDVYKRQVEDVVNIGDELEVKVNEIDAQGRINLIRNDIVYENNAPARRPEGMRRPPRRDGRA